MRRAILNALRARYEAEIAEADATANIYLNNSVGIGEHPQHIDYGFQHTAAVFSLNTCDGFTRLADGTKIDSVANRIVFFDGSSQHNSTTCTNQKGRFNINFNFL